MSQPIATVKRNTSFKKLFAIYMKTSKKRVVTTILIGAIIFLALTSFFMIWYSQRYNSFFSYMDQNHDWIDDNKTSIHSVEYLHGGFSIDTNYLFKATTEVTSKLEELMPNVQKSSSSRLTLSLYNNISVLDHDEYYLQTFDENITNLIVENVIAGRMPENYTELIYYKATPDLKYNISEIIELSCVQSDLSSNYNPINYTVVGIVDSLDAKLYNENLSTDLLKETYNELDYGLKGQFFTTNTLFYDHINTLEYFTSRFSAAIDINYQFTIDHIVNKNKYLAALQDFWGQEPTFDHMPSYMVSFCQDLIEAFDAFERDWQIQTISLIGASVPIVILFGVITIETFTIGSHEQESKYRLLKTQGVENKVLAKMVLYENVLIGVSSFLIGFTTGLVTGLFIFMGLNLPADVSYFAALRQAIIMVNLIILFVILTLLKFGYDVIQTRKVMITTATQYMSKRRKILRKIFSVPEVTSLLPGALLTTIGILFLSILSYDDFSNGTGMIQIIFLFYFVAAFGILLLLISVFLLLSRLIDLIWRAIGKSSWKNRKSYFTLALKHLSISGKNYKRTMLAVFVFGLGVIPGLIVTRSIALHTPIEANLTTGCSDILIDDWQLGSQLKSNISNIDGVMYSAEVNILELTFISTGQENENYEVRFLALQNITEYLNVVDFTLLTEDGYSINDIALLETDLTYLMSRKYAQRNDYDKGVIFNTREITDEIYQPLDLIYVNDFSYYPLLTRPDLRTNPEDSYFFNQPIKSDLVVSKTTAGLIRNTTSKQIESTGYLLIKTETTANKTKIQEELSNQFGYTSITPEQIQHTIIERINKFTKMFLIATSIITTLAIILFGTVNAISIYKQRLRIIEPEIRVGAKRRLIWGNFTIELMIIVLLPMIISIGVAIPIINAFSGYLLNITDSYIKFTPWQPWWLLVLTAIGGLVLLIIGWFIGIIPRINNYRAVKQE